jgi:hypothetical protein
MIKIKITLAMHWSPFLPHGASKLMGFPEAMRIRKIFLLQIYSVGNELHKKGILYSICSLILIASRELH